VRSVPGYSAPASSTVPIRPHGHRPSDIGVHASGVALAVRQGSEPQHAEQTRALHRYLWWRNTNARHPRVLAVQRCERARIRSEKGVRWCGRALAAAA
jgi:hypothetical protein